MNYHKGQSEKGYTFIELMMVLAILTVLFGFTITIINATRFAQNTTESISETGDILETAVNMRKFSSDFATISDSNVINFGGLPDRLTGTGSFVLANDATATISNSLSLPTSLRPGFQLTVNITNEACFDYASNLYILVSYLRRVEIGTTVIYNSSPVINFSPAIMTTACNAVGANKNIKVFVKGS